MTVENIIDSYLKNVPTSGGIDESDLDAMEKQSNSFNDFRLVDGKRALELLRLARLGLWAEKYGIPVIAGAKKYFDTFLDECKHTCEPEVGFHDPMCMIPVEFSKAIAALPKKVPA